MVKNKELSALDKILIALLLLIVGFDIYLNLRTQELLCREYLESELIRQLDNMNLTCIYDNNANMNNTNNIMIRSGLPLKEGHR